MKQRLINCDFINAMSVSNKAKLLYVYMFVNADDLGFVSNVSNIITLLTSNEGENNSLELLNNDYNSALEELGQMGLLYRFTDKHNNSAYLIRHWFIHNKWKKELRTNYYKFRQLVKLEDYEYHLKESSKERVKLNINENNINQDNTNQDMSNWDYLVNSIDKHWEKESEEDDRQIQDTNESIGEN